MLAVHSNTIIFPHENVSTMRARTLSVLFTCCCPEHLDWCLHEVKWKSFSRVWLFETPWTIQSMEFSKARVGSLSLLQGIFPTQGWNPGLPHCRRILYQLSHKGCPVFAYLKLINSLSVVPLQRNPGQVSWWQNGVIKIFSSLTTLRLLLYPSPSFGCLKALIKVRTAD